MSPALLSDIVSTCQGYSLSTKICHKIHVLLPTSSCQVLRSHAPLWVVSREEWNLGGMIGIQGMEIQREMEGWHLGRLHTKDGPHPWYLLLCSDHHSHMHITPSFCQLKIHTPALKIRKVLSGPGFCIWTSIVFSFTKWRAWTDL